ncbi:putative Paraflagellar rod protein [Trypanosoma vivax]|nr:hypothetical protein TRVL_00556 [Trypanosoma vivax]KAH8613845.1 putative Paraflagellar rod protein [Trypanosoma vivax]
MSSSYPERRPYATVVPNSGYLSKPLLPPVEALRILSSAVGIDLPRSTRRDSATPLQRQISSASTAPLRGVQLFKPPTLESATPFEFQEKEYHNSQQVTLNMQLNNTVEELFKQWYRKLRDVLHYLEAYPAQATTTYMQSSDAIKAYFTGYRTTDVMPMTAEQLIRDFKLVTTTEMLDAIQSSPVVVREQIRHCLDTLLNAKHFLAPIENYVEHLEPLAAFALPDTPNNVGEEEKISSKGPVWVSRAAVTLHEKFHFDPSEYALRELHKSDQPIERLENRVLQVKERKEDAIDMEKPGEALNFLTTQVDLSNDLLLMNKARMELVHLHSSDIQEMKKLVDVIIEDARHSVTLLKRRIDRDKPLVQKDIEGVSQDLQNTTEHIKQLDKVNAEANKAACEAYSRLNDTETELWSVLLDTMKKLLDVSNEKEALARKEMRLRELRARDMALATELLRAQQSYCERLRKSEETIRRWESATELYEAYVEAFVPRLLKKVHDAEEAAKDLYNCEAQSYVRRYEMFEYAVEEGRATRSVHVDRLKIVQRAKLFDVERAQSTLDPHADKYRAELDDAQAKLEEGQAFIDLLEGLAKERRAEVEPILQHVICFNRTMQGQAMIEGAKITEDQRLRDKQNVDDGTRELNEGMRVDTTAVTTTTGVSEVSGFNAVRLTSSSGKMRSTADSNPMMATVAHPHVQARTVGLNHEEAFLEKFKRFTEDEQTALEGCADRVRHTRNELERLGDKYDNTEYVKMLLTQKADLIATATMETTASA